MMTQTGPADAGIAAHAFGYTFLAMGCFRVAP